MTKRTVLASRIPFHERMFELFPRHATLVELRDAKCFAPAPYEYVGRRTEPFTWGSESSLALVSATRMVQQYRHLYDRVCGNRR